MDKRSLIIPVFNGAAYLPATFEELSVYVARRRFIDELVFVNDGSTDATAQLLEAFVRSAPLRVKVLHNRQNSGKGFSLKRAVREGVSPSCAYVGFTDVELPYGCASIDRAFQKIREGEYDMVAGERVHDRGGRRQYSWYRYGTTHLFRLMLPARARAVNDTQCGLKVFSLRAARRLFDQVTTDRWVFDVELFLAALGRGMRIARVPVAIKPSCASGRGGVLLTLHGLRVAQDIWRIRHLHTSRQYEAKEFD